MGLRLGIRTNCCVSATTSISMLLMTLAKQVAVVRRGCEGRERKGSRWQSIAGEDSLPSRQCHEWFLHNSLPGLLDHLHGDH
jgi:hypothetical protein